jgi:hypothetical protein
MCIFAKLVKEVSLSSKTLGQLEPDVCSYEWGSSAAPALVLQLQLQALVSAGLQQLINPPGLQAKHSSCVSYYAKQ